MFEFNFELRKLRYEKIRLTIRLARMTAVQGQQSAG